MSKGSTRRPGSGYGDGYDGIDWGRKEDPKPSVGQIWMRKSAMEPAYFEQTAAARALAESAAKTCQHCKHWTPWDSLLNRGFCENKMIKDMILDCGSLSPVPDFGCNKFERKP